MTTETDSNTDDDREGTRRSETRGVSPLVYELFVLGELMVQPLYGYLLREIATNMFGAFSSLSWGVLYPLVRKLEQQGLIVTDTDATHTQFPATERGQPRRIYKITSAGQARFLDLMVSPAPYSRDTPKIFTIKLTKFQFLIPTQRTTVLRWYRPYLVELYTSYRNAHHYIVQNPLVVDEERRWILVSIDHQLQRYNSEIEWLDRQMGEGAD